MMKRFFRKIDNTFGGICKYFGNAPFFLQAFLILPAALMTIYATSHFFVFERLYTNEELASDFFKPQIINNILVFIHIGAAMPALLLGPWMFHQTLREDRPQTHRKMGKVYVYGCLISAVTVFPIALANHAGFIAHLGFGTMAVVWFLTTYLALTAAMNKNFAAHRRWMMRSYALTFAFVHVNFTFRYIFVPYHDGITIQGIQAYQSMVSWLINLFFVEIYLAATNFKGEFWGFKRWYTTLVQPYNKIDKFYWKPAQGKKKTAA